MRTKISEFKNPISKMEEYEVLEYVHYKILQQNLELRGYTNEEADYLVRFRKITEDYPSKEQKSGKDKSRVGSAYLDLLNGIQEKR